MKTCTHKKAERGLIGPYLVRVLVNTFISNTFELLLERDNLKHNIENKFKAKTSLNYITTA